MSALVTASAVIPSLYYLHLAWTGQPASWSAFVWPLLTLFYYRLSQQ